MMMDQQMTLTSKTAKFHPSSAHRWFNCPGSATAEAQIPYQPPNEYALEGLAVHALCAYFVMNNATEHEISQYIGKRIKDSIPRQHDNNPDIDDIIIDPEMASAVWMYCDYIKQKLIDIDPVASTLDRECIRFEERITTKFGINGIADCIILDWPTKLSIIDFKYGAGVSIDAKENLQMLIYALGALNSIESDFESVEMVIVQPRDKQGEKIKSWTISIDELNNKWLKKIQKAHSIAIAKPNLFRIGDWCKWCKATEICPKATRTTKSIVKDAKKAKVPVDVKKLSKLLQSETLILEYLNQAKLEAFNRLQRGEVVPGFKLVQSFGHTKWKDEEEVEEKCIFGGMKYLMYNEKLKSPNQMKKSLKQDGLQFDWVDKMTIRPLKGLVLVPESDKRPEYKTAKQDFEE